MIHSTGEERRRGGKESVLFHFVRINVVTVRCGVCVVRSLKHVFNSMGRRGGTRFSVDIFVHVLLSITTGRSANRTLFSFVVALQERRGEERREKIAFVVRWSIFEVALVSERRRVRLGSDRRQRSDVRRMTLHVMNRSTSFLKAKRNILL